MLMSYLFLGELLSMKTWIRLILVIAGLLLALFFNLVRTVILVWIANAHGFAALENWHDPAGFGVLGVSLVLLWIVAQSFRRGVEFRRRDKESEQFKPFTAPLIVGFASWFLFFLIATESWYRRNEANIPKTQRLSVEWPKNGSPIVEIPVSAAARRILFYDSAKCAAWEDGHGVRWIFYSFVWNSGRTSTQSARIHC